MSNLLTYFPKLFSQRAIQIYFAALTASMLIFFNRAMSPIWLVFGTVAVVGFFYFSNVLTSRWATYPEKIFLKKVFQTAFILRLVWVIFSYFFYIQMTGQSFEFSAGDSGWYNVWGGRLADRFLNGNFNLSAIVDSLGVSDSGYPIYLGIIYSFTGKSILIVRIIKALLSAYTCVLIYRLAARNFGEPVGKMAAIFCMLTPNLIYYCGLHLKETEMVFLTVAFVERADHAIRSQKFAFSNLILPILLAGSLFFFRTVLGAAALFAFLTAIMLSSEKILGMGRRIILGIWIALTIGYFIGGNIASEVEAVWAARDKNQAASMEYRATQESGNTFARYAGTAVFAPMIFVIPFPTMVHVPNQENQMLIHGGNYVKNIMAFFTMLAIVLLLFKWKTWRQHLLIITFIAGYLMVIAMSAFAQSERFHLPALPFTMLLAAFGVSQMTGKKLKKYFNWWTIAIFVAIVAWSWFKLAGRGMV
ncbi:MAG: hypothetical protein LBR75_01485 [Prevotellaceae bacterium]|jgi:hypothetical protein|nr:hypothetical protein [Prevotellaceae bacterium]